MLHLTWLSDVVRRCSLHLLIFALRDELAICCDFEFFVFDDLVRPFEDAALYDMVWQGRLHMLQKPGSDLQPAGR
jgi:hypothetical protein